PHVAPKADDAPPEAVHRERHQGIREVVLHGAGAAPRMALDLIVREHTEGRDDVLGEVLILVIAPHDHEVWRELVQNVPRTAELLHQGGPMPFRCGHPLVVAPLLLHGRWPAGGYTQSLRKRGVRQGPG